MHANVFKQVARLAVVVVITLSSTGIARADQIINTIDTTIDPALE